MENKTRNTSTENETEEIEHNEVLTEQQKELARSIIQKVSLEANEHKRLIKSHVAVLVDHTALIEYSSIDGRKRVACYVDVETDDSDVIMLKGKKNGGVPTISAFYISEFEIDELARKICEFMS